MIKKLILFLLYVGVVLGISHFADTSFQTTVPTKEIRSPLHQPNTLFVSGH